MMMRKQDRLFFSLGVVLALSELWKQWSMTYIVNNGNYDWWYFPFQLCSIPMYLCLLLPFINSEALRRTFYTFLMDFGLLGGIFAFFDTSGMHSSYFPLTLHSYFWHILLIFIGVMAGLNMHSPSRKDYRNCVLLYLGCSAVATVLNIFIAPLGTINMFFISPNYPMTQKVFWHIAKLFGNPAGIISYIAASVLGAGIFHLLWKKIS